MKIISRWVERRRVLRDAQTAWHRQMVVAQHNDDIASVMAAIRCDTPKRREWTGKLLDRCGSGGEP